MLAVGVATLRCRRAFGMWLVRCACALSQMYANALVNIAGRRVLHACGFGLCVQVCVYVWNVLSECA